MKKIIPVIVCILIVACAFLILAQDSKLSGTYEVEGLGVSSTYTFKGNKVTITAEAFGIQRSFEGKYKITESDKELTVIVLTFEDSDAEKYSGEFAFAEGEENGREYIRIGGVRYNKVD